MGVLDRHPRTRASTEPLDQASDAENTASHHALDQGSSVQIMDVLDLHSSICTRFVQIMDVLVSLVSPLDLSKSWMSSFRRSICPNHGCPRFAPVDQTPESWVSLIALIASLIAAPQSR
jgi:hypothetical protein